MNYQFKLTKHARNDESRNCPFSYSTIRQLITAWIKHPERKTPDERVNILEIGSGDMWLTFPIVSPLYSWYHDVCTYHPLVSHCIHARAAIHTVSALAFGRCVKATIKFRNACLTEIFSFVLHSEMNQNLLMCIGWLINHSNKRIVRIQSLTWCTK